MILLLGFFFRVSSRPKFKVTQTIGGLHRVKLRSQSLGNKICGIRTFHKKVLRVHAKESTAIHVCWGNNCILYVNVVKCAQIFCADT